MPEQSKPLFSRPVLAAIMLLSTLGIWVLNLTAPSQQLPTPSIAQWHTESGIPVTWLTTSQWQEGNKLELSFIFQAPSDSAQLTHLTLAMLMSDSLPLSTATINQRLSPLAAKASANFDSERQILGLTFSNESQYLEPTLNFVQQWLSEPSFKQRTFANKQQRTPLELSTQMALTKALFKTEAAHTDDIISLSQVHDYYQTLKQNLVAISVVGPLGDHALTQIQNHLNQITQGFQLPEASYQSVALQEHHTEQLGNGQLWQTNSALALQPLSSTQDWVSLQLWGGDLVRQFNQEPSMNFVQLNLSLTPQQPWAWWNIQYRQAVLVSDEETTAGELNAASFVQLENLPSVNDQTKFNELFDTFKQQVTSQALSPTWWNHIATQVVQPQGPFDLQAFADQLPDTIDNLTRGNYKERLESLFAPSSYQEIQVYQ
ncbi:insulinase family protein [Marinomonas sp.]